MSPLLAANWKMNGDASLVSAYAEALCSHTGEDGSVWVFPPACYLQSCRQHFPETVRVGAQNVSTETSGAYTGECSTMMMRDLGLDLAMVGHSERRQHFFETQTVVQRKLARCFEQGMSVLLCVGETAQERRAKHTYSVLAEQLSVIDNFVDHVQTLGRLTLAYEPVWAIGSGASASPQQAAEVHGWLRGFLGERFGEASQTLPLLYGGSVNPSNASALVTQPEVDGVLVGGASLDINLFLEIGQCMRS